MADFSRREFIKLAGNIAGAATIYTFLPGIVLAGGKPDYTVAASSILHPTFMSPEIIEKGKHIFIKRTANPNISIKSVRLASRSGDSIINMKEISSIDLSIELEPDISPVPGMYDLLCEVEYKGKKRIEHQPHSISIVDRFKDTFNFGVISDVHFGDPRVGYKLDNFDVEKTLIEEIEIFKSKNIEFCICCGDLCFLPPKSEKEIIKYFNTLTDHSDFPTFTAPGNHDGYSTGTPQKLNFDTYKFWNKTFGPLHTGGKYGDFSLIGLNTFDKEPLLRNVYGGYGDAVDSGSIGSTQLSWLKEKLKESKETGNTTIMFGHHNPTNTVIDRNGPFEIKPFSDTGRNELLELIEEYQPELLLSGHVHGYYEEYLGKTHIVTAPTAASLPAEGHAIGILVFKVENGKIDSVEKIDIAKV